MGIVTMPHSVLESVRDVIREADRERSSRTNRERDGQGDRERGGRRGRNRRREKRVRKLEARVEQLESELRWLRRVVRANGDSSGSPAVGPCPNCRRGVLVRRSDELRCASCRYTRFL
ncbi:hypothetical protein [Halorussus lipolyticus]|uniref:hypothetical protein n=1 Tax=Halorussus lipolyticus TaxID=3034024 RepID=UPI0023E768D1|nr:hypothetical protein [Halorussus sp. DT80]